MRTCSQCNGRSQMRASGLAQSLGILAQGNRIAQAAAMGKIRLQGSDVLGDGTLCFAGLPDQRDRIGLSLFPVLYEFAHARLHDAACACLRSMGGSSTMGTARPGSSRELLLSHPVDHGRRRSPRDITRQWWWASKSEVTSNRSQSALLILPLPAGVHPGSGARHREQSDLHGSAGPVRWDAGGRYQTACEYAGRDGAG